MKKKTVFKLVGIVLLLLGVLMAAGCVVFTARNIISDFDIFNSEDVRIAQLELTTAQTELASQKELTTQTLAELDIWREKEILAGRDVEMEYAVARSRLLASVANALTRQDRMHALMQTASVGLSFLVIGLITALLGWIIYTSNNGGTNGKVARRMV